MVRKVWSTEELALLLAGARVGVTQAPRTDTTNEVEAARQEAYRRGFAAALLSIAVSAGIIRPPTLTTR
jgi:hypothetical protein